MTESFVFHLSFIENLPEERIPEFTSYIVNYGLFNIEPSLSDMELAFWKTIRSRIDADKTQYRERIDRQNEARKKYRDKIKEISGISGISHDIASNPGISGNICTNSHSEFEFDSEFEFKSEFDSVSVSDVTPPQKEYAKQIFKMWNDADMPGSKDLFKFTSREFKNALTAIKGYHSDEVIGACKNYLSVLKDSSTWVTKSLTFDKFVNSKLFTDCLPDNFVLDNFKADNWMKDSKTLKMPETPKKFYSQEPCRKCGKKKLWFDNDKQKYICDSCGASFEFEDIQGAYLNG